MFLMNFLAMDFLIFFMKVLTPTLHQRKSNYKSWFFIVIAFTLSLCFTKGYHWGNCLNAPFLTLSIARTHINSGSLTIRDAYNLHLQNFFDATTNEVKLYLYRYINTDLVVSIPASLNIMVVNVTVFKGLKVSPHKSCSASPASRRS